jgi:hypothetical protein
MSSTIDQTKLSTNNDKTRNETMNVCESKINENGLNGLMKKLEAEGEKKLQVLQASNTLTVSSLTDIMEDGFSEFRKKTGRNPTYGEMRAMYG